MNHILAKPPHYGLSKWSSLQASEKAFKAFLGNKGIVFPKTHNLYKLAELSASYVSVSPELIKKIQCQASVRYGKVEVSIYEAYSAHLASIELCGLVVNQISA